MGPNAMWQKRVIAAAFAGAMLFGAVHVAPAQTAASGQESQIQTDVAKALDKKQFHDVTVNVLGNTVVLSGTVSTYADKEDADRRAHHRKNVHGVQNEIRVAGAEVDDTTLRNKLAEKLEYDRVGYGTTAFNAMTVAVQNGVVTLGGVAYGPPDRDSAVSLVANTPGVKDVIDNIEIAPLSPNDDRIRIEEARAIYGFSTLSKYAMDPGKPIRIMVVNGNVTLAGVVDTQADKDTANIRANGVSGVFKVTNLLQVVNQKRSER